MIKGSNDTRPLSNNRGLGCRDPVLFKSKKEKDDDDKKVDHVR